MQSLNMDLVRQIQSDIKRHPTSFLKTEEETYEAALYAVRNEMQRRENVEYVQRIRNEKTSSTLRTGLG